MNQSPISPSDPLEVRMSELMTPEHANFLGQVFGGAILALLDKVAYVTASRYAQRVCVTASFERVDFHSPIDVGELVHFVGRVVYVGRTSIQVRIEVFAENLQTGTMRHTNSCTATLVAIDEHRRPTPVRPLRCETREDKQNFVLGKLRREMARKYEGELREKQEKVLALSDEELEGVLKKEGALLEVL